MKSNRITYFLKVTLAVFFSVASASAYAASQPTITIEGKKYTNYALITNSPNAANSWEYKDPQAAIDSGKSTVIVNDETIQVNKTIQAKRNWFTIIGKSRTGSVLRQTNPTKDLLQVYANGVTVKNLTLDTKTHNAYAAYVVGDGNPNETTDETLKGNNNVLQNCDVYGGNKGYTLYVAGPTYRESIYDKYSADKLSNSNTITGNYFEGTYVRDAFVFALQESGEITNNTFVGGELDAYMTKWVVISGNTFLNSNKTAIFISGPTDGVEILNNKISGAKEHGIKSFYQIDNLPIPQTLRYIRWSTITGNTITNSGENGMDMNYLFQSTIKNNTVTGTKVHGISVINESTQNEITGNTVSNFGTDRRFRGSGIFITVSSSNNIVSSNKLPLTDLTKKAWAGIFVETNDSVGNEFKGNTISGEFDYAAIYTIGSGSSIGTNSITTTGIKTLNVK